jgi:acyl carrier protein
VTLNGNISTEDRIITVVQRVLEERSVSRPICPDDVLIEVGMDSLDVVKLVLLVESEFDLTIPTEDISPANFRSISAINGLVARLLNEP